MTDHTIIASKDALLDTIESAHHAGDWVLIAPTGPMWVGSLEQVSKTLLQVLRNGLPQGSNDAH
jgi:hypothetical protein